MPDYSKWEEKLVAVSSLQLDPQNPRVPPSDRLLDQRELIAELVQHDNVLELAKDIAQYGYAPVESLIGCVVGGKNVVLEGNRRLAALKLLLSPESAPDEAAKKVRGIVNKLRGVPTKKVRVLFAPDRQAAAPLIMKKHTRVQIERWSPLMQARFYRTLAASGLTVAEMAEEYGSTAGEIGEFLRTDAIYEIARRLPLPDEVARIVRDPRKFGVSTLQRIVDTPKARQRLGIDFDEGGKIVGRVAQEDFSRAFVRILTDVATGAQNTRTLNSAKEVDEYLNDIGDDLPSKKSKGSFSSDTFMAGISSPAAAPKASSFDTKKKLAAKTTRASKSVIPTGTKCQVQNTRIRHVFDELRGLSVEKYPNASGVLFRILLELTLSHYLDVTGKSAPLVAQARKKGKSDDWCPTLSQMLNIVTTDTSIPLHQQARKRINKFVSDPHSPLAIDGLDAYVHNRFTTPTERELRNYWEALEGLFEVVLQEPPKV